NISEENICTVETNSNFTEQARKTLTRFSNRHIKDYCENYEYFLSLVTSLFSEIEDLNTESISFESMYSKKIYNYIFYYGWNKYINDHIENYNSIIINSVKEFKDVLDVAESLLFYEKYFPGYVSQYEIICLYEKMEGILLEIKNEENLGLFYELIKFAGNYESKPLFYVNFVLSIIGNQLKNISIGILKGIKISKCNKNIKYTSFNDEIKEEYLKIVFIQRLFSKLLPGMKNGISTVKLNLEIIDKIKVFANKSSYISENLAYLREKYLNLNPDLSVSYKHLTLNDIFLSEICLSSFLSRQYEDLLFDNKIIPIGWKRLYENKIKSPEYTLDVKN
ncbi:hypothetical protein CWI36_1270p0010, partial [Hamiltosporidium magnivora]